jgi:hypothetical protein
MARPHRSQEKHRAYHIPGACGTRGLTLASTAPVMTDGCCTERSGFRVAVKARHGAGAPPCWWAPNIDTATGTVLH